MYLIMYMRFDKVKNLRWMLPNGGAFPDVFDPAFTTSASLSINKTVSDSLASEVNSPWVIGWITDESDDLNGISTNHTHPGWTALATAPSQSSGKYRAVSGEIFYTDTKSYTKYALQDFLKTRYGTIEALNTAWGSSYTTWESDGGYQLYSSITPTGNGWLDENGKHSWMGKDQGVYGGGMRLLQGTTPVFQKDLNDFETLMVQKYFKVVHDAIRSVDTNHLIIGPVTGAADRPEWILGIKGYADAIFVLVKDPNQAKTVYDLIQTPIIGGGIAISAEADSPLAGIGPIPGSCCIISNTQEERGAAYANLISTLTQTRATDGTYPVVGFHWWALVDNFAEKRNYGLVTIRDNAYDGKEDKIAAGTDAAGYPVGGEKRDYGNFLSSVIQTHNNIYNTLSIQMGSFSPDTTSPSTPASLTATAVSSTQINLSWTASTDNVGVTGYKIYRCAGSACAPITQIATSATNSYSNTGLTASTAHTYAVSAYDVANNESAKSSSISATTSSLAPQCSDTIDNDNDGKIDFGGANPDPDCSSPTDTTENDTTSPTISSVISTTLASTTARIDWTTNEPGTSQVEYGFTTQYGASSTLNTILTTSHSVLLSNLSPDNTTYNYRVRSKDSSNNESISTNRTFITPGLTDIVPPASTTNLTARNITQTSVDLVTWTASGDDGNQGTASLFDIRYTTGELTETTWNNSSVIRATGEPTPKIAGSVMNYTLVGLTPNTTYKVALKTLDEVSNQSLISNIVTFTTLKVETAPTPSPTPTPTPAPTPSPSSGGGLVSDTTPPAQPKNFKTISADKQIILQWKNPPDLDFVRIIIIRKENSLPTSKEDGAIIYEGTNQEFTDINLDNDKTYYYAIYAYDQKPNYSTPVIIKAQPAAGRISIPLEKTIEPAIPFPNGSLLKTADSDKIYFIVNNKKRWITNPEVFISYGFTPNSQITVQKAILDQYEEEKEIIKPSHSEGTLVRASNDFKVYIIKPPFKRHIFNPSIFNMYKHFNWNSIREIDQDTLNSYITSDLYRAINDPKVFSLEEVDEVAGIAKKRWLDMTPEDFVLAGYNWNQVFVINPRERDYYQEGEPVRRTF